MSRFRLVARLRQNDYWKPLLRALDEAGIARWELQDRKPHPAIVFTYGGREVRFTIPSTPRGGSQEYVLANFRRRLREIGAAS